MTRRAGLLILPLVARVCGAAFGHSLDENCVVSALNRTARADASGVWVLPNVPANQGPVRVRATCVENATTRSGQSDFFSLPANGIIEVADIRFDSVAPIPATLRLTAPATSLTSVGQPMQLMAIVTYADGVTRDVTQGTAGTDYRTSNPATAAVSADGLVTAQASGRVLVSALHEGALGVIELQVVVAEDSDG